MNDLGAPQRPILFVPVGDQTARLYGLDARQRAYRIAEKAGLAPGTEDGLASEGERGTVIADLAFAWDPAWLNHLIANPGHVLVVEGRPVLAHCTRAAEREAVLAAIHGEKRLEDGGLVAIDPATTELNYHALRKRERPFIMPLRTDNRIEVEKALYDASYKGVTDLLTLYLWRRPAFHLTRWAAAAGLSPNMVTAVGAILCVAAFFLFWQGHYWWGVASGFGFMVLDTVDGKLARCTGTSSYWGNIFDHGIDLVHPPFWWWAWAEGLKIYAGGAFRYEPVYEALILAAIIGGYVVQRVIEGIFMRRYGMHIHVWRRIDSRFRLITARRNPNMLILVVALALGRPDVGLELVALWTIVSLIFHAVRLTQAESRRMRGEAVTSWLS
ncbi:CDP-alcohol phosphatidyltransferase family protein [Sphingomicrobium lutaoense]|uniref:Phosphatidylglycerophosphate synthase n=1 Tax=Sphingomicrobium lutaoense TaxID=515949 RepID=A0A839Z6Z4_9SPHN|nr:CDP-alcohol phosphatidyltransferase family protein [Sphingomicrobium lutaoense]MBB3764534.1 phosphatidylglycerophosphate synthase [Sphingomicrobium lutaoense]